MRINKRFCEIYRSSRFPESSGNQLEFTIKTGHIAGGKNPFLTGLHLRIDHNRITFNFDGPVLNGSQRADKAYLYQDRIHRQRLFFFPKRSRA